MARSPDGAGSMKPASLYLTIFFALLAAIVFVAGCTGGPVGNGSVNANVSPDVHIVTPPSYAPAECTIPPLIFNDSMNITVLHIGLVIARPGTFNGTDAYPIPDGSIIYHSRGWITRIFDASGRQILIVNDTQSYVTQNTGNTAATLYFPYYSPNDVNKGTGKRIQYYLHGSDSKYTCNMIWIYDNWTNPFHPMIPINR
jgi:hypothetical protein